MKRLSIHFGICLVVMMLLGTNKGFGQEVEKRNFSFYSQKDGLSNYNIHKILQDNKSFLWIATQDGLNRFDGTRFTVYNKGLDSRHALLSNDIHDLVYDSVRNILWTISNQGGINGIDIVSGIVIYSVLYSPGQMESSFRTCAFAFGSFIYIGTVAGMELFDTRTLRFVKQHAFQSSFPNGFRACDIRCISSDSNNNLWVSIKDKGVLVFDPVKGKVIKAIAKEELWQQKNDNTFWPLTAAVINGNQYWLGTQNSMYRIQFTRDYKTNVLPLAHTPLAPFAQTQVNNLAITDEQNILIAGNRFCTYNVAANTMKQIVPVDANAHKWLSDIVYSYEDRQHNVWVGCKQGLGELKSTDIAFTPVRNSNELSNKLGHVYNVIALDSARVLAGTSEGLFLVSNGQSVETVYAGSIVQNLVRLNGTDIFVSKTGGMALYTNGRLMPAADKYRELLPFRYMQLNSKAVVNDSIVVLGTESYDGILVWNLKARTVRNIRQADNNTSNGLFSNTVNTVFATADKHVAVLSDNAITLLDLHTGTSQFITYNSPQSSEKMGVYMDIAETYGNYWINVYSEGLLMLNKSFGLVKIFSTKDGISNMGLYKLFNYQNKALIATSNNGISVFDIQSHTFKTYYEADGLQNNTFEEACGDTLNGIIYAGGVEGFVKIDPSRLQPSSTPPQLFITRLQVVQDNQQTIDTFHLDIKSFEVPPDAVQTNVEFSGIYYANPGRVQYAYRIKENKSSWIGLNGQNYISLVGLHNGTYTLQIIASNEDGVYSGVKELKLHYQPRWFESAWFQILAFLSVLLLMYSFYRYRLSQLKMQHTIRRNLASDLHDDIGSSLNTIKVLTHLARNEQSRHTYLDQIESSLTEATTGLRDLIWVLDDSGDTIDSMIERIRKFVLPVATANGIVFECKTEIRGKEFPLSKTEKRNLLLMMKETINNSIKYADCTLIKLLFVQETKRRIIEISDNGKGFNSKATSEGNGLKNLTFRAAQIHHMVSVISSPGHGTLVRIVKE